MIDINTLSLEEKINQTVVYLMKKDKKIDYTPGAAFFFGQIITDAEDGNVKELRGYINELYTEGCIPPLVTSDFENGCGSMVKSLTPLPYMMALGATGDPKLAYNYGKATALEARYIGANWTFSPVCDLNLNRRNPLINVRGLTDDTELACSMLPEVIRGMQDGGIAACAKHFPGDGVDYRDQHIVTTENSLSMEEWWKTYGKTYKAFIKKGVKSIMAGHITLPDFPQQLIEKDSLPLPATLNKSLITDLLKGELGFEGIVVTDALGMGGFKGWYDSREISEIESFKAGCDMMLWPTEKYRENLKKAILDGDVPISRLDDAVTRILKVKEELGLLDKNYQRFRKMTEEEKSFVKSVQEDCSNKSITLIKDKLSAFPLNAKKTKNIGIIAISEHNPAFDDAKALKTEFEKRGFKVDYRENEKADQDFFDKNDFVICATFSRPFRPIGFIDYTGIRASAIAASFGPDGAFDKLILASFGSPYFYRQYFPRVQTAVNCYSMLACQVEGFVKTVCGEIEFTGISPVKI